jgi:hypothetical protein
VLAQRHDDSESAARVDQVGLGTMCWFDVLAQTLGWCHAWMCMVPTESLTQHR